jgi:ATP-dependent DNA ligase
MKPKSEKAPESRRGDRLELARPCPYILCSMSATRELRRRLRAEQSLPRFEPCLPRPAQEPPAGPGWLHEIKHDGFRILAHRQSCSVRLRTRNGHDLADRFPLAAEAIEALPVRSCVITGVMAPMRAQSSVRSIC